MSFFAPQNPGIGGLDELTNAEELFLTTFAGLSFSEGQYLRIVSGSPAWVTLSGGGSSVWGSITGTLSAQTDLQAALDFKFDNTSALEDIDFDPTAPHFIQILPQSITDTAGGNLTMKSGDGNGTGDGGAISIIGGDRGLVGLGGDVILRGGIGDDAASSGHVQIIDPINGVGAVFNTDLLTAQRTFTFPDVSGVIALVGGSAWDKPYGDAVLTYDIDDNLETKTVGVVVLTYLYDIDGNLETVSDGVNTKTFTYTSGNLTGVTYS